MKNPRLWGKVLYGLAGVCALALIMPQFRLQIWENSQQTYLYMWGGHAKVHASVAGSIYLIAALWGVAAVAGLFLAGRKLHQHSSTAIAWMNWAAFFIAMELIFLLTAAEEVLTDLRVMQLQADSFASWGSWTSFTVLFILLFLPSRIKKWCFKSNQ